MIDPIARLRFSVPVKATCYMLGAVVSFALMAIAGRTLATNLDTFEIMTFRSLFGIILVLGFAWSAGTLQQINTQKMGLHLTRNLCHFFGQNLWFYAILFIPLAQMFTFEFTTPLWVAIGAPLFLKEKLTGARAFAAIGGFAGIVLVARPDFSSFDFALVAACLCALGFAGATLATKKLTTTQTTTCILFWLTVMQAVLGLLCAGYDGDIAVPAGTDILWVMLVGVCGLAAHFCITSALGIAPATLVTPLEFTRLPLVAAIGFVLYDEQIGLSVIAGALIVLAANLVNVRAEQKILSRSTS